jgi:hypothetical protein
MFDEIEDRDGNEIVLSSSRGWMRDADGWWLRPSRKTDHPDHSDCHVFYEGGMIYCRNAKQKRRIDNGLRVA